MINDYDWTIEDTYAAQNLCPYETVSGMDNIPVGPVLIKI